MDSIDCIVPEKLERLAHRIQQALEQTHSANLSTPHQSFQKISQQACRLLVFEYFVCVQLQLYRTIFCILLIITHSSRFYDGCNPRNSVPLLRFAAAQLRISEGADKTPLSSAPSWKGRGDMAARRAYGRDSTTAGTGR